MVICRIGSLENVNGGYFIRFIVICRIGSLEILPICCSYSSAVICRIGSLENPTIAEPTMAVRYLPHRQFRKFVQQKCD